MSIDRIRVYYDPRMLAIPKCSFLLISIET